MSWIARAAVFRSRGWYVFCLLLALTVFLGDFFTTLGFAHGNLYFAVVMLSALTRNQRFIALVGILCIALTCVGFFISPPGFELVYVLSNRFLSVLEIGGLTLLLELVARQIDQLEDSNQDLRASREMIDEQGRLLDIAGEAASMGGLDDHAAGKPCRVVPQSPGDTSGASRFYARPGQCTGLLCAGISAPS